MAAETKGKENHIKGYVTTTPTMKDGTSRLNAQICSNPSLGLYR